MIATGCNPLLSESAGGSVGARGGGCPRGAGRRCVPGCGRQGVAAGSRGRPGTGRREGGELPPAETLNRLHFPQILPFPLLPQAGGEAASTALRAPSPGLALPPGTASSPPPKVGTFFSLLFLASPSFSVKAEKERGRGERCAGLPRPWAWRGRPPRGPGRAAGLLVRPWVLGCAGGTGAARSEPAWRDGAGGWRPHGARPHLPPGFGSMK